MKYLKVFENKSIDGLKPKDIWCVLDRNDMEVIELFTSKDLSDSRCEVLNTEFNDNLRSKNKRFKKENYSITKYYSQTLESCIDDIKDNEAEKYIEHDESY